MPFHIVTLGDFEIITLQAQPDRIIQAANLFPTVDPKEFEAEFAKSPFYFGKDPTELRFTQNICAIKTDKELILVDTGVPHDNENSLVLTSLKEAGIEPDDITLVILTHRDMDHVGGTLKDGKPAFPRAQYVIGKSEYDGYKVDSVRTTFPTFIAPLEEAGILDVVADDAEVSPGVRLMLTPGHRPGATSVLVGDECLLTADVWHCPAQIAHPEWHIGFDTDPDLAVETRSKVIELAARHDWLLAVPHTPEFGLGRIGRASGERIWIPFIT